MRARYSDVVAPKPEDAVIIRMFPTHAYPAIARAIGWTYNKTAMRGLRLGLRRTAKIRDLIPVPVRAPTPDDGAVAALVGRWTNG